MENEKLAQRSLDEFLLSALPALENLSNPLLKSSKTLRDIILKMEQHTAQIRWTPKRQLCRSSPRWPKGTNPCKVSIAAESWCSQTEMDDVSNHDLAAKYRALDAPKKTQV